MIESLIISLILTVIIELVLAVLIKIRDKENLSKIILVNCITNPIIVYLTNITSIFINNLTSNFVLIFLEILNIFVEGFLLKKYLEKIKINTYIISLYLNGLSFLFGILVEYILKI